MSVAGESRLSLTINHYFMIGFVKYYQHIKFDDCVCAYCLYTCTPVGYSATCPRFPFCACQGRATRSTSRDSCEAEIVVQISDEFV